MRQSNSVYKLAHNKFTLPHEEVQMRFNMTNKIYSVVYLIAILLSACGGGGGSSTPPAPLIYTISGTVTDLVGSVVLQNNLGDDLVVTPNGTTTTFIFNTKIASSYSVTVFTQPLSGQTCDITSGSGTATANVTNVTISCAKNTTPRYAFTANVSDNSISTYVVDSTTGRLKFIGKTALTTSPRSVTVDPTGKHVYVVDGANVLQYTINANGSLTPIGTGTIAAGTNPISVTIDPLGRFAFVANKGGSDVSAYTINSSTGALLQINCGSGAGCNVKNFTAGTTPQSVTVDPSGKYAYAANSGSNDVSAFGINPTTGALAAIGTAVPAGTTPQSITVDPSGKYAYVANSVSNDVSAFGINPTTGALAAIGTAVPAGTTPQSITVDPSGKYVYVANFGSTTVAASISQFSIDTTVATGGALIPLSPASAVGLAGTASISIAAGNASQFVSAVPQYAYVANKITSDVSAYRVTTGVFSKINCSVGCTTGTNFATSGNSSSYVTVDPTGKYAYVTNGVSNNISAYSIDATNGVLSPISCNSSIGSTCSGINFSTGITPTSVSVDPSGQYVYVANSGGTISQYAITGGALTPIGTGTIPAGFRPQSITVDPSGKYVYVANQESSINSVPQNNGNISQYAIGSNGALSLISSPFGTGTPQSITADPSGQYLYVVHRSGSVAQYTIGSGGVLTSTTPSILTGTTPLSVTVDPSGHHVYVANFGSNNLLQYNISTIGAMTSATTTATPSTAPYSVTIDPSGKYAYVANNGNNTIAQLSIDATTGALTAFGTPLATGSSPVCVISTGTWQ
jgi:6-phosphogluconolactonase (cycloisomerase 2 family)